ncbi:DUF6207 family protein [Streptomyces sp. NPDC050315]|uniref:DUF6207 family protein n=1 Tax=Streptomyces sp. NPDC050315 TaxID=3155039 RepID=UPI00341A81FA
MCGRTPAAHGTRRSVPVPGPGLAPPPCRRLWVPRWRSRRAAEALAGPWACTGPSAPWREPGAPGLRVRVYADLRQPPCAGPPCAVD